MSMTRLTAPREEAPPCPQIRTHDADCACAIPDCMRGEPVPPPARHFHRQGMPDAAPTAYLPKKRFVDPAPKYRVQVIGVGDHQNHPTDGADPLRLAEPDLQSVHLEYLEQRVILRQRVRQLDESSEPVWEYVATPTTLRLVRIGIVERSVIVEFHRLHPLHVSVGRGGAKTLRPPFLRVAMDGREPVFEHPSTRKQLPIVLASVHAYLMTTVP